MAIPRITVFLDPPGESWWGDTESYDDFVEQLRKSAGCPVDYRLGLLGEDAPAGIVVLCRPQPYRRAPGGLERLRDTRGDLLRRTVVLDLADRGDAIETAAALQVAAATMPPDFSVGLSASRAPRTGLIVRSEIADALRLETDHDYLEHGGYRKVACTETTLDRLIVRYLSAYWERVFGAPTTH